MAIHSSALSWGISGAKSLVGSVSGVAKSWTRLKQVRVHTEDVKCLHLKENDSPLTKELKADIPGQTAPVISVVTHRLRFHSVIRVTPSHCLHPARSTEAA